MSLETRLQRIERQAACERETVTVRLFMPIDDDMVQDQTTGEVMTEAEFARRYPHAIYLTFDDADASE